MTILDEAVEAAAKAMYEQHPHATDPTHWETPWEDVPKAWRRGQLAAARAVLEAATPWLQPTLHIEQGDPEPGGTRNPAGFSIDPY